MLWSEGVVVLETGFRLENGDDVADRPRAALWAQRSSANGWD